MFTIYQKKSAAQGFAAFEFRIKDTGRGMSEDFVKKIFEPFERAENSTVSKVQGTGLGMAITKNMVDQMGGVISVKSQLGVGSEFIIDLPMRIAEDPLNQQLITYLLKERGATTTLAKDGVEVVKVFEESAPNTFDLIFMDIMMPNKNGLDATRDIRALDREDAKTIPIIAMTANAFEDDKRNSIQAGMNDHISKPFKPETLDYTLREYLSLE